jgi:DMSO/TMAO reductase YedYZ molybdopterin-dependent catalytic subunit
MTADLHDLERLIALGLLSEDEEREACNDLDPDSGYVRPLLPPHMLNTFITPDDQLFQTINMGAAVVNQNRYIIKVDGLVERPFSLCMAQLKQFPSTTVTAFHECYGPPLKAPTENYWRIGNMEWTGARLKTVLDLARPLPEAQFVWSDGLDYGQFGGVQADRYQKDLPIEKALSSDVLLAYEINGKPPSRNRGGPVRLVVPGWFGTNMTKWLCRLSLQPHRAPGPFTTIFL